VTKINEAFATGRSAIAAIVQAISDLAMGVKLGLQAKDGSSPSLTEYGSLLKEATTPLQLHMEKSMQVWFFSFVLFFSLPEICFCVRHWAQSKVGLAPSGHCYEPRWLVLAVSMS